MTFNCAEFSSDFNAYIDEQLEQSEKDNLEQHLGVCEDCRQEIERLTCVSQLLVNGSKLAPMPELWEKLSANMPSICEVVGEDLSAYIDNELSVDAQEGIKAHLKDCSSCGDQLKALNSISELAVKELKLPDSIEVDLWAAVRSRLNEDCALIQGEISAFLDQEVTPGRHRIITAHLIGCPTCRGSFDELSQVGDSVRSFYQPVISDDFDLWTGIKSKLQVVPFAAKAKSKQRLFNQRLYLATAAAVVIGLAGSLAFLFIAPANNHNIKMVSAESYLLDSAMNEPGDSPEAVVYGNQ